MKLHRLSVLALFLASGVLNLFGQTSAAPATVVATNRTAKHCLWEVKGKTNSVFLLGSLHLMKKDMYPLDAVIENAYQRARIVVFETDINALESPELAMKLMAEATYPEGETLKQHLPAATYSLLVSNLQSSLGSAVLFEKFKPWMAAVTLVAIELQKLGFAAEKGLDKYFYARTKEDHKTLQTLESPDEQLKLLTSLGDQESADFLGQSLGELATLKTQFNSLAEAWQTGDARSLDKLLAESFREYPLMEKRFLTDRNQAWFGKVEALLKGDKDALIVVGAGHLVGKGSLTELLSSKGYQVEQR